MPAPFGARDLVAWRLDPARYAPGWDSGEGAYLYGGRWNSVGRRVVYCALDPATAILEVAAHIGFRALDAKPYVLTSATIGDASRVHVVQPGDVPDAGWLLPGMPGAAQQAFGDSLLGRHPFVAIPSAVSPRSWNLLLAVPAAAGLYALRSQESFALDPRLRG